MTINKIINPCKCKVYTRSGKEADKNAFVKIEYNNSIGSYQQAYIKNESLETMNMLSQNGIL